jgi:hypothetical protein
VTTVKPTQQEFLTLHDAYSNALLYGIGVIKVVNTPQGPVMSVVSREEYLAVADHLKFAAENTQDFTDKPSKS